MSSSQSLPATMRAVQVHELTGLDGLRVSEAPVPQILADQVLIQVSNFGLSSADLLMARGQYQSVPPTPFTIGMDLAGVVVAVGEAVSTVAVGDRVAATMPFGAAAEYAAVSAHSVFALPDSVSLEEGAALPTNYLTAYFALVTRAGMQPGDTVLVHGAAGGVGTAVVQVSQALGARTIAVVSSEEKAEFAAAHGAREVVLTEGFKDAVLDRTEGRGVDIVVDTVGASVIDDSLRVLAFGGRHMVVGFAGGEVPMVKANRLLLRNIDVRGVGWGGHLEARAAQSASEWAAILPLLEQGELKPAIGGARPFEETAGALSDLDARRAKGKLVLTVE